MPQAAHSAPSQTLWVKAEFPGDDGGSRLANPACAWHCWFKTMPKRGSWLIDAQREASLRDGLFRRNSLDEMSVRRREVPLGSEVRPAKRERARAGSHEDAGDVKRQKRRPGKTRRSGR
jgi:hypothetical protein